MDLSQLQMLSRIASIFKPQIPIGDPGMGGTIGSVPMNQGPQQQPDVATQIPNVDPSAGVQPQNNIQDALTALRQYNPSDVISKQYAQALTNMPQRTEPSFGRKLLGGLAGLGAASPQVYDHGAALGFKANIPAQLGIQDEVANKPYYDKLRDWTNQTTALGKGAAEEDRQNVNKRILFTQGENADIKREDLKRKEEADRVNAEIRNKRADAYVFDKQNPSWKPYAVKGGNLIYVNPKDPTQTHDTGIPTGSLSDEDKIKLQVNGRLTEIAAQGGEQRKTEGVKQQGRIDLAGTAEDYRQRDIASRGNQARDTKATPSGTKTTGAAGARAELPTQTKARIYNAAQKALIEHPEWSPYLKLGTANTVTIATPPWYKGGAADKATMDAIHKAVYESPESVPANVAPKSAGSSGQPPQHITDPTTGNVYNISTWKQADIDAAKKRGWK